MPDGSSGVLTHAGALSHFWLFYTAGAAGFQMGLKVGGTFIPHLRIEMYK